MCTADGTNYFAHLTSEIFFPFFSPSPFSTNYSKTMEINRFFKHVGFGVVHGRRFFCNPNCDISSGNPMALGFIHMPANEDCTPSKKGHNCTNTKSEYFDSRVTRFLCIEGAKCAFQEMSGPTYITHKALCCWDILWDEIWLLQEQAETAVIYLPCFGQCKLQSFYIPSICFFLSCYFLE